MGNKNNNIDDSKIINILKTQDGGWTLAFAQNYLVDIGFCSQETIDNFPILDNSY